MPSPIQLRNEAHKARRLARFLTNRDDQLKLMELAAEYDKKADALEAIETEPKDSQG